MPQITNISLQNRLTLPLKSMSQYNKIRSGEPLDQNQHLNTTDLTLAHFGRDAEFSRSPTQDNLELMLSQINQQLADGAIDEALQSAKTGMRHVESWRQQSVLDLNFNQKAQTPQLGLQVHTFEATLQLQISKISWTRAKGSILSENWQQSMQLVDKILENYQNQFPETDYDDFPADQKSIEQYHQVLIDSVIMKFNFLMRMGASLGALEQFIDQRDCLILISKKADSQKCKFSANAITLGPTNFEISEFGKVYLNRTLCPEADPQRKAAATRQIAETTLMLVSLFKRQSRALDTPKVSGKFHSNLTSTDQILEFGKQLLQRADYPLDEELKTGFFEQYAMHIANSDANEAAMILFELYFKLKVALTSQERLQNQSSGFQQINLSGPDQSQAQVQQAYRLLMNAVMLQPQNWLSKSELAWFKHKVLGLTVSALQTMREAASVAQDANFAMPQDWVDALSADQVNPALFWIKFAELCTYNGLHDEAIQKYEISIQSNPGTLDSYLGLGQLLSMLNRDQHALQCLFTALQRFSLSDTNQFSLAQDIQAQKRSISLIHQNISNVYAHMNQLNQAYQHINIAIQSAQDIMQNWILLALLEKRKGRLDDCFQICEKIIQMDPNNAGAYELKGDIFKNNQLIEEAFIQYSRAVELNPESSSGMSSLGDVLKFKGKLNEALQHYKKALSINVNQPQTLMALLHTKLICCDWQHYDELFKQLLIQVTTQVHSGELPVADPFNSFMLDFTADQKFEIARKYSEHIKQQTHLSIQSMGSQIPEFKYQIPQLQEVLQNSGTKIRIGYMSWDFADHPLSHLLQSIFKMHDRSKFSVVGFSLRKSDQSSYRMAIEQGCDEFFQIDEGMSAVELASFVNSKNIQILFNLNGWTMGERTDVFVLRPAPIQIQFMGFCSSMGADFMDYLVTDQIASPPECLDRLYSEKVIYMPNSYYANDYKQSCNFVFEPDRPTRKSQGLPEDKFIFANFNQLYKIDPTTFQRWMNILLRVPDSVLWLLEYPEDAKENLFREAQERGVDPSRLIFTPKANKKLHINRCYLADLALDNAVTNGHTTSCDLLWSGLPMVTYAATENMPSRVASSICYALGCPEMVSQSFNEYEEKAVSLALNRQSELRALREKVERNRLEQPLFDTALWVSHLEVGLIEAWRSYSEEGGAKRHIDLSYLKTSSNHL